jgi:hypothetical protein
MKPKIVANDGYLQKTLSGFTTQGRDTERGEKDMQNPRFQRSARLTVLFFFVSCTLFSGCGLEPEDEEDALGIQPVAITLDATGIADVVFTVWGGTGVYAWSISDDSLGTIVSGDTTAIYTSKAAAGENTVMVTDGSSWISAVVTQE